ncbi:MULTISPECIES: tyrosine-type recombinase/integrase [Phaeobacter]|jgi:integrase/recombinase XerD|uniref:Site-specific recombinase XerD n=1 Tax=Phaeobacter piscinae TaxID=1580596 RepID=A0AAN1GVU8_9RHOB|nr:MULTISPECIES: tyrosine-type recombinase/integrase [Phaeobacter]AHD08840.1 Site-specific recombinase XerD [Phaeobacter gallaeciensis DSM 26640]AHD11673.1 Site-specific recombinase XerD [Phaeobacter gallaeciensis DSM 26640]ATE92106.1 Site-specific recombinase XerD [Phaeobacter gallaeciensis]ATE94937.1 Site-specific recombinase XerD [Phaeobacter gallaeciensis]ATG45575.1 Site-specific recombinase XerD [Phaeobacter piscinae]
MKTLCQRLDEYLALRRSMGFALTFDERVLRKFTTYGDERGFDRISTPLFLDWKANYGSADNNTWSCRLGMVRRFAFWLAQHDDRTEIPSSQLVTGRYRRRVPYIYAPSQIANIVAEAGRLPSPYGLRAALWQTLFGLIAVTGMRVNEALSLDRQDVDLKRAFLTLRNTKNGRDRQLPVNGDTALQLARYAKLRDRLIARPSSRFFIKEDGEPAGDCGARYNFAQVSGNIGLRPPQAFKRHGHGPRIHDLRHSFAVHTILDWFREGRDIEAEMYKLSTYLGHSEPKHTFWYIEAVPELMHLAAARAEQRVLEDAL